MSPLLKVSASVTALALAACVSMPTGPAVMVLPGTGKSFDEFRFDDGTCRQFAYEQIGGHTAAQAQSDAAVSSAVVGTVIGTAAGAAIGGSSGAAAGAGVGLLGGSMYGASASSYSGYDAQHRYDIAYQQCMYAKGHRVPVAGRFSQSPPSRPRTTGTPPPPPPPNQPPPPG